MSSAGRARTLDPGRVIISIDLDYFYAQCEEVRRPELKNRPLVICVLSGRTETSGAVSTTNYVARNLGVRSGIPIVAAKKILAQNKEAEFLPMDHEYYEGVSERVMQLIRSHSSAFEQVSIDEAFIDATDISKRDFAVGTSIGKTIKNEIFEEEKLTCSIGIGPNKLISKMAADYKKPNGLLTIAPESVTSFLRPMSVGKLIGIGPKSEKKLEKFGIRTIGDLADSDVNVLTREFGKNLGPHFKELALGIDSDPVKERPIEQLSRMITLKKDAESMSFEEELKALANDLSSKLQTLGIKSRLISIIAITSELKTKSRAKSLDHLTDSSDEILSNSLDLFRSFFESSKGENVKIRRAGIRVSSLTTGESEEKRRSEDQSTLTSFLRA
jgi:DNA polymerase IV (DinB-like DNA polymerase)